MEKLLVGYNNLGAAARNLTLQRVLSAAAMTLGSNREFWVFFVAARNGLCCSGEMSRFSASSQVAEERF